MHGLEAVAARMGVEENEFLLAVRRIVRVIDIEHDAARHTGETGAEQVNHSKRHACKSAPGRRVFKTRQCWLGHEVFTRLGPAPARHLECRIDAQCIEIVAVLVPAGDGEHPRSDHVGMGVDDAALITGVRHASAEHRGHAEPLFDLAQNENTAIRGELSGIERGCDVLAADR